MKTFSNTASVTDNLLREEVNIFFLKNKVDPKHAARIFEIDSWSEFSFVGLKSQIELLFMNNLKCKILFLLDN